MTDFQLPKNWETCNLGKLALLIRGVSYEKSDASSEKHDGYFPIFRANNIQENLNFDNLIYVPKKYISDDQLLKPGDIVIAASSGSKNIVGKAAELRVEWIGSFGAFCMGLRPFENINSSYIAYFLQTKEYRNKVSALASGVNINNLRREHIEGIRICIPPRKEQDRIVAKLEELFSDLDAGIAALERAKANLKRYRASVLKAAVEGKLTAEWRRERAEGGSKNEEGRSGGAEDNSSFLLQPSSLLARILKERRAKWEENQLKKFAEQGKAPPKNWRDKYEEPPSPETKDLPKLPENIVWCSAEQICDFITKGTTPSASKLYDGSGDIRFLKVYNLTFSGALNYNYKPAFIDYSTHAGELQRSKVQAGDVLINIVGPPLGQVSLVPDEIAEANINQAIARFRPLPGVDKKYLTHVLMTESVMAWAIKRAKTTAGQANLTLELCRDLPLPLMPVSEQQQVTAEVERRLSIADATEKTITHALARAARLRQAILKRAFEGRLVPQDPNDEPASELLKRIQAERAKEMPAQRKPRRKTVPAST